MNWKAGLGLVTSVQLVPEPFYCPRYKGASPASTRQMLRRIVKILLGGGLVAFLHREPDLKPKSCIPYFLRSYLMEAPLMQSRDQLFRKAAYLSVTVPAVHLWSFRYHPRPPEVSY